jgi:hypothetical protein
MESYHDDASAKLGNDWRKLQVLLPFGEQWRADVEVLKMELKALKMEPLRLYAGNLLIALGKMAFSKLASDSCTHRLQQRLQVKSVETDLAAAKIPSKYWPFLKKYFKSMLLFF